MLTRDYLYICGDSAAQPTVAAVVLPEIFGPTDSIKRVADRFAKDFGMLGVVLDHFYAVTGKSEAFDYHTGREAGMALMQKETGKAFSELFNTAVAELMAEYPSLQQIVVCGFCFGGRLSYVAATNKQVSQVISFYGAGANMPDFMGDQSAIESLAQARRGDEALRVLSFYGAQDGSIPPDDRLHTRSLLDQAGIHYTEKVYPTGHAYFNEDRETYHQASADASWQDIKKLFATQ